MSLRASTSILAALALSGCATPSTRWADRFGGVGDDNLLALSVDTGGDTLLSGWFSDDLSLGGTMLHGTDGVRPSFVALLDPQGDTRFARAIGSDGEMQPLALARGADGTSYVAGTLAGTLDLDGTAIEALTQDTLLLALGPGGDVRWWKHFSADDGGPSGVGFSSAVGLAVDPDGDLILAGQFSGDFGVGGDPINTPALSAFLAKLRPDGSPVWATVYDNPELPVSPSSLAVDPGGDILLAGSLLGPSVSNGFVARFDPSGARRWDLVFSGNGSSSVSAVAIDPRGGVLVTGDCSGLATIIGSLEISPTGATSPFVARLSPAGDATWATILGGGFSHAFTMTVGEDRVIVGGSYIGTLDQRLPPRNTDSAYLLSLDLEGHVQSGTSLSPKNDAKNASNVWRLGFQGGDLIVAGGFLGDIEVDGHTWSSQRNDIFLARMAP